MSAGNKNMDYKWVETSFPLFAVNPLFKTTVFTAQQVSWEVTFDLNSEKMDAEWVEVMIKLVLTLRKKDDNKKIAELITTSFYEVRTGLTTEEKMKMAQHLVNETTGQMQGGWVVKTKGATAAAHLPQAYNVIEKHKDLLRKTIKQKWGQWSGK